MWPRSEDMKEKVKYKDKDVVMATIALLFHLLISMQEVTHSP